MAPKNNSTPVTTARTHPVRVILRPGTLTNSKTTTVGSKTTAVSSKTNAASLKITFAGPKFSRKLAPASHGAHSGERDSPEPDEAQSNSDLTVCTYSFSFFLVLLNLLARKLILILWVVSNH